MLVLVRPETVALEPAANGAALAGEVISHTFFGPIMRLKLVVGENEMTADVPASRSDQFPVGLRVAIRFPADSPRLLTLG